MASAVAATASDCATPPSKKGQIGDNLFDVDSDPDLAPGRFSSPASMSSLPGQMTSSGLSEEASAFLQAINSSLGPRIDTANNQLASMNHRMINIESAVTSVDGRVSATEKCLEEVRHRTEALERRNCSSTASSASAADGGTGSAVRQTLRPSDWTPPAKGMIIESLSFAETPACLFG